MLQSWLPFKNTDINGPSWFFGVMTIFYLIFPCIVEKMKINYSKAKAEKRIVVFIILMFCVCVFVSFLPSFSYDEYHRTHNIKKYFIYFFPPVRLIEMLTGCNLGYIFFNNGIKTTDKHNDMFEILAIIVSISSTIVFCCCDNLLFNQLTSSKLMCFCYSLTYVLPTLLLIIVSTKYENNIFNKIANQYMMLISRVSPYAFIIHTFVIDLLNRFTYHILQFFRFNYNYDFCSLLLRLFIGFPVTIILSYIYMKFQDRYILKK